MTSPFSDDVVPHLSERDARLLAEKVCERVFALGASVQRFGVSLDHEGFWFVAVVNNKEVSARTGQGNFRYEDIAKDLVLASVDKGWNRLTILPPEKKGPKRVGAA
jgi:hypothetical protein